MFIKNSLLFSNFKKYRSHFIVLKSSISTTVKVLCVGVLVFALSLNASGKTRVSTSWSLNSGKTVNSNYVAAGFSVRSIDLNSLNSINYFLLEGLAANKTAIARHISPTLIETSAILKIAKRIILISMKSTT